MCDDNMDVYPTGDYVYNCFISIDQTHDVEFGFGNNGSWVSWIREDDAYVYSYVSTIILRSEAVI